MLTSGFVEAPTRFEWDDAKAASNQAKHGVSFGEAAIAVRDPRRVVRPDARYDYGEVRLLAIGAAGAEILSVVHTFRGAMCRIISARRANRREREEYLTGTRSGTWPS